VDTARAAARTRGACASIAKRSSRTIGLRLSTDVRGRRARQTSLHGPGAPPAPRSRRPAPLRALRGRHRRLRTDGAREPRGWMVTAHVARRDTRRRGARAGVSPGLSRKRTAARRRERHATGSTARRAPPLRPLRLTARAHCVGRLQARAQTVKVRRGRPIWLDSRRTWRPSRRRGGGGSAQRVAAATSTRFTARSSRSGARRKGAVTASAGARGCQYRVVPTGNGRTPHGMRPDSGGGSEAPLAPAAVAHLARCARGRGPYFPADLRRESAPPCVRLTPGRPRRAARSGAGDARLEHRTRRAREWRRGRLDWIRPAGVAFIRSAAPWRRRRSRQNQERTVNR